MIEQMETISDEEIIAGTVRYARAAQPGTKGSDILAKLTRDFPDEPEARIRVCMGKAADLLLAQHGTF